SRHTRSKRDWSSDVCSSDLSNPSTVKSHWVLAGACECKNAAARRITADGGEVSPCLVNARMSSSTATNRSAPIPRTGSNTWVIEIGRASSREGEEKRAVDVD